MWGEEDSYTGEYKPEVLETVEILEQPDDIFNDLKDASGKSITELQWNDSGYDENAEELINTFGSEEDDGECSDYEDCDDEFDNINHAINQIVDAHYEFKAVVEERLAKLEQAVFKRMGPPVK